MYLGHEQKIETVIVSNSTNINKTHKHLSPDAIVHKQMTMIRGIGNPDLVLGLHTNVAVLNRLSEFQPPPDNIGSPTTLNNTKSKQITNNFQPKRPHVITNINENLNMDSTIVRSVVN